MAQKFNNKLYVEPGAAATTRFQVSPRAASLSTGVVLVIGESEGGLTFEDSKIYEFGSSKAAKAVLLGGPSMDAIQLIFAPSPDFPGAEKVIFVRAQKAAVASYTGSTSVTKKKDTFTLGGTLTGGTIGFDIVVNGAAAVSISAEFDTDPNTTLAALKDAFNAAIIGVTGTINPLTPNVITFEATSNNVNYTFSNVVEGIGGSIVIANVVPFNLVPITNGFVLSTKDKGEYQGGSNGYFIKESSYVYSFYKGSTLLAITGTIATTNELINFINSNISLKDILIASAVDVNTARPVTAGELVPFTVSADPAMTINDFSDALSLTADIDKNIVYTHEESSAFHSLISAYCLTESEYECISFVGGALGETRAQAKTRALGLNTENVTVCYPGVYLDQITGTLTLYSSAYHAAIASGLAAGLPPQVPLTRKKISVKGFEIVSSDGKADKIAREDLIDKGVFFSRFVDRIGYVVNKGINSIQGQINRQVLGTDDKSHEISIVRIKQTLQKEFRIAADLAFAGTNQNRPSREDVFEFAISFLNKRTAKRTEDNLLLKWYPDTLEVSLQDDAWFVSAEMVANGPINHVFMTNFFVNA